MADVEWRNFLILYLPNLVGYYLPAVMLTISRRKEFHQIERFWPSVTLTFVNLHLLLPLQVLLLVQLYHPATHFFWPRELVNLLLCLLLAEVWFYFMHRIFHTRFLFRHVHSLHHRIVRPHVIHSGYQHPVEFLIPTMGTCLLGPIVLGCHPATTIVWIVWMMGAGTFAHGGYFPRYLAWMNSHDRHHRLCRKNFGLLKLDDLFRTRAEAA
jgi:sterol desaturase/sphingolipid hydroxylase (fatty acid hydroxylase superfamily)